MASYAEYLRKAVKEDEEKRKAAENSAEITAGGDKLAANVAAAAKSSAASTYMTESQLAGELNKIDDLYKVSASDSLPDPIEYERLEYDAPTDEEIEENAASALEDYRKTGIEDIENDSANRIEDKENERTAAKKTGEEAAAEAAARYEKAIGDFESDALKRGLARSSIALNKSEELQSEKVKALTDIRDSVNGELSRIDGEINALVSDREKALSDFNIAYAAKLTEKISELTEKRDEKQAEVLKYNNSLAEKEREDQLRMLELYGKMSEQEGSVPESKLAEYYEAKYNVIREYLSGLDADKAAREIKDNPLLRNSVSDYFYYRLYNEFAGSSV